MSTTTSNATPAAPRDEDGQRVRHELALTLAEALKGRTEDDFLAAADAVTTGLTRRGWRPPLAKADVNTLRALLAGIIDGHGDAQDRSLAAAQEIVDEGYVDRTGVMGPPEPVATTLRRIIRDVESEAARHAAQPGIGELAQQSVPDLYAEQTLRAYADRLRQHPALAGTRRVDGGSPEPEPLGEDERQAQTVADRPTTRDALIERYAESLWRVFGEVAWKHLGHPFQDAVRVQVGRLLDAGVLADPAERAELEALREQAARDRAH